MTTVLPHRALGASGIEVSVLSLGSWMTFEHMSREDGVAVMRAPATSGIDFLDDRAVRRPHRHRPDPDRVLRGGVRGSVPGVGLATRGRHRREQALARVLARRESRRRARRVLSAHGLRLPRSRLLRTATRRSRARRSRRRGRRAGRLGQGARMGSPQLVTGAPARRVRAGARDAGWRLPARRNSRTTWCRGSRSKTTRWWPHSTAAM